MEFKHLFSVKNMVRIAVLVAIAIVLKSFLSIETQIFRVTFYDIPLMILGLVAGPIGALAGGFIVDWLHVMYSPFAFSFNLFTVSSMMWGFIPGLFLFRKQISLRTLIIVVVITSIVAFSLNTIQLYIWYGSGIYAALPMRIAVLVIKLPIQVSLVRAITQALFQYDQELMPQQ
jgi:ECF transporter S component (folate family)